MILKILNKSSYETPKYESMGAAGLDIRLNINEEIEVPAHGKTELLPTGLFMEIPFGYEGEIRPRSGLACKHGVTLANSPATIDSDYRGEIKLCLINNSNESYILSPGERVAQMLIKEVEFPTIVEVTSLSASERSSGGFGSTGKD